MQAEFQPLIDEAITRVKEYFGKRFLAAYLHGSLNYGDAIPNISDMDCYIIIENYLNDNDKAWIGNTENNLQNKYPIINGVHLSVHSLDEVKRDAFTRFMLKYNSSLYDGIDVAEVFNTEEFGVINPNRNTAKMRVNFAKNALMMR